MELSIPESQSEKPCYVALFLEDLVSVSAGFLELPQQKTRIREKAKALCPKGVMCMY